MAEGFRQLGEVTEAVYTLRLSAMQKLASAEAAIRADLARLDAQGQEAARAAQTDHTLRALGADLLWQGWVGRKRSELLMKLARVLAEKEQSLSNLKHAFGRNDVMHRLTDMEDADRRKKRARRSQ